MSETRKIEEKEKKEIKEEGDKPNGSGGNEKCGEGG